MPTMVGTELVTPSSSFHSPHTRCQGSPPDLVSAGWRACYPPTPPLVAHRHKVYGVPIGLIWQWLRLTTCEKG
jgi:hypothetical protein